MIKIKHAEICPICKLALLVNCVFPFCQNTTNCVGIETVHKLEVPPRGTPLGNSLLSEHQPKKSGMSLPHPPPPSLPVPQSSQRAPVLQSPSPQNFNTSPVLVSCRKSPPSPFTCRTSFHPSAFRAGECSFMIYLTKKSVVSCI